MMVSCLTYLRESSTGLQIIAICIFLSLQCSHGFAQTLRVGLLHFPPFGIEGQNEHDPPHGIIVERLSRTFNRIGLENEIKIYPAKRLFRNLEYGSVDFLLASESQAERFKDHAVFSTEPLMITRLRAYSYNKIIPLPEKKEDLNGLRVVTIRGYSYSGYLNYLNDPQNQILKNTVNTHKSGFLLLISGRADILLDYAYPAEFAMESLGEFEFNYKDLFRQKIFFAMARTYPNGEAVLDQIVETYRTLGFDEYQ